MVMPKPAEQEALKQRVKVSKCGCGKKLFHLTIDTHVPEKYILIDAQTHTVCFGSKTGWK